MKSFEEEIKLINGRVDITKGFKNSFNESFKYRF